VLRVAQLVTRAAKPAAAPKRAPGRPAEGPGGEPRDVPRLVRWTRQELAELERRAKREGVSVAEVIRRACFPG
jgi:hypothetical protein